MTTQNAYPKLNLLSSVVKLIFHCHRWNQLDPDGLDLFILLNIYFASAL